MVTAFAILLVIHALIHLLGSAKAFGLAALPQLTQTIPPAFGALWLTAALMFLAATVSLFAWPRGWWAIGVCAIAVSMVAILPSWTDAKFGAVANGIAFVGIVFGFLAQGPVSLRAEYDHDVESRLAAAAPAQTVTAADLAHLPAPVHRYLGVAGVVGQPRVRNFRVRLHGRIRSGREAAWMPLEAEQYNFVDVPARLFYLNGSMMTLPVQGYHRYVEGAASMRVKAAGLVPVVRASGAAMTQGETVTMFNDMCLMAPATLIDPAITWQAIDAHTAKARFTNAGHTIQAELTFNDSGELTNFGSDDRYQVSPDGSTMRQLRWSTPVGGYRTFGGVRLASMGEGRWHQPEGEYAYIELTIDEIEYNVQPH